MGSERSDVGGGFGGGRGGGTALRAEAEVAGEKSVEVVHGVVRREERIRGRVGGGDKELRQPEIGGEEGRADGGPTARGGRRN